MRSLKSIVRAYQRHNHPYAIDEINFFRKMPSSDAAIDSADTATDWRGKRFDHQRRLPISALRAGTSALSKCKKEIKATHSFQELHELLQSICNDIAGLGEPYAYDTALRLGAFMGFEPEYVYLHAGTRVGARALGIDTSRQYVAVDELPELLHQLLAYELEDILCIYKDRFRESAN